MRSRCGWTGWLPMAVGLSLAAGCVGDEGAAAADAGGDVAAGGESATGSGGDGAAAGGAMGGAGDGGDGAAGAGGGTSPGGSSGTGGAVGGNLGPAGGATGGRGGEVGGEPAPPEGGAAPPACDETERRAPIVRFDSGLNGARILDERFPGHETLFLRRTIDEQTLFVSIHRAGEGAAIFQSDSGVPGSTDTLILSGDDWLAALSDANGDIVALDTTTGAVLWRENIAQLSGAFLPETYVAFARDHSVYVAADDGTGQGEVTRIDLATQQRLWSSAGTAELLMDVVDGVVLTANYNVLEGRDLITGTSLWRSVLPSLSVAGIGGFEGIAIILDSEDISGVDPQNGRILWSVPVAVARREYHLTEAGVLWTWEADLDGHIRVMGIDLRTGRELARVENAYLLHWTQSGWAALAEPGRAAWLLDPEGHETFRIDSTAPAFRMGERGPLYVVGEYEGHSGLQAFDRESGARLWDRPDPSDCVTFLGADADGRALCATDLTAPESAEMVVRSAEDGRPLVDVSLAPDDLPPGSQLRSYLPSQTAGGMQRLRMSLVVGERVVRDRVLEFDASSACP